MFRLIKLIIWIFAISGIIFYINYKDFKNSTLSENKIISIKSGDTIIPALKRELGYNELFLKIYLKLNPEKAIEVQSGNYSFLKGENIDSIIKTISYGAMTVDAKLVILEGRNIFDIDECLSNPEKMIYFNTKTQKEEGCLYKKNSGSYELIRKGIINSGEFISESKNLENYKNDFAFLENALTLEGYLYPDTYFINPNNFSLQDINKKMLENFKQKVYNPLLSTLSGKQINEIVTIASIVEKEERNVSEKSTVAGILIKRYRENWMIGADITACYAYKLTSQDCKMQLSNYIYEKNDYNTRTMTGLPKTPINNPSVKSIEATLNPKSTPYYYYLHDGNGKVYYGRTNEEHNANKKYLK